MKKYGERLDPQEGFLDLDRDVVVIGQCGGPWSTLFVNGVAVYWGDHGNVFEFLVKALGIEFRQFGVSLYPEDPQWAAYDFVEAIELDGQRR